MQRLASFRLAKVTVLSSACLLVALGSVSQLTGCDDPGAPREPEDKTGVHEVPSPSRSAGVGLSGAGGDGGSGGSGGSTATGAPCVNQSDCEDGDTCTIDACDGGMCTQKNAADDGNLCTMDTCNSMTGDISNTVIVAMDDMNACTIDQCDPATGSLNSTSIVVFEDTFKDNAAGWVLGPEWQIGTANASIGALNGGNDPDMDFTMTDDNGVAGTDLAGLVANTSHGQQYMTSPAINLTGFDPANEFVTLHFRRWLNTEAPTTMKTTVEVNPGTGYVEVWKNEGPIYDATNGGWFEFKMNITSFVGTGSNPIRIRFGFDHVMTATASVGGWNIDDVRVERWSHPAADNPCQIDTNCDKAAPTFADIPGCQK